MNDNTFVHDTNSQFALSYELLHLLRWLVLYNPNRLKKIIAKALSQGLHDEIQNIESINNPNMLQEMHHSMIDFFELLDELLTQAITEHVEQKARENNLLPALDVIDSTICDSETVRLSIEKTTKTIETNPNANAQEQLFKEILKKWKPLGKNSMN